MSADPLMPVPRRRRRLSVRLNPSTVEALEKAAAARSVKPGELARRALELVLEEGLERVA